MKKRNKGIGELSRALVALSLREEKGEGEEKKEKKW